MGLGYGFGYGSEMDSVKIPAPLPGFSTVMMIIVPESGSKSRRVIYGRRGRAAGFTEGAVFAIMFRAGQRPISRRENIFKREKFIDDLVDRKPEQLMLAFSQKKDGSCPLPLERRLS